jgi:hypothetical protein
LTNFSPPWEDDRRRPSSSIEEAGAQDAGIDCRGVAARSAVAVGTTGTAVVVVVDMIGTVAAADGRSAAAAKAMALDASAARPPLLLAEDNRQLAVVAKCTRDYYYEKYDVDTLKNVVF